MPSFLFAYHGGDMPASEEEGAKVMQDWMTWMASLGESVVDGGNPVGKSKTVHPGGKVTDDGGANPTSGYSVIRAADADDAIAKARTCPHLSANGSIEVAEIIEMG